MFSPFKAFILVMIGCLIGEIFAFYIGKLLGRISSKRLFPTINWSIIQDF